jgi:hypothetical protein
MPGGAASRLALLIVGLACTGEAFADRPNLLQDRLQLSLGFFTIGSDTRVRAERFELTGTLGLHYTDLAIRLRTELEVADDPVGKRSLQGDADLKGPLPAFGVNARLDKSS